MKMKIVKKSKKPDGINPIEENLLEIHSFACVMPFLDRYDTLVEIKRLRKLLSLKNLIPQKKYKKWFEDKSNDKKYTRLIWTTYHGTCLDFLRKCSRQDVGYHALWKAVVCGKVVDDDCIDAYVDNYYLDVPFSYSPELVIVFSPNAQKKDILKAFGERDEIVKKYFGAICANPLFKDIKSNVNLATLRKQRKLYWKYIPHEFGYGSVAKSEEKNFSRETYEEARSSVRSYSRRVKKAVRIST